jgi:hypothetical protein
MKLGWQPKLGGQPPTGALQPPVQPRVGGLVCALNAAGGQAAVQPKNPVTVPAPSAAGGHAMKLGWHPKLGGQPPTGAATFGVHSQVGAVAAWGAAAAPVPAAATPGLICALARTHT